MASRQQGREQVSGGSEQATFPNPLSPFHGWLLGLSLGHQKAGPACMPAVVYMVSCVLLSTEAVTLSIPRHNTQRPEGHRNLSILAVEGLRN